MRFGLRARKNHAPRGRKTQGRDFDLGLKEIEHITGVAAQEDVDRAKKLGADPQKVVFTGNLKRMGLAKRSDYNAKASDSFDLKRKVTGHLLVAGSSHRGEEEILLNAFRSLKQRFPDFRMVLAPRHPQRFAEVERLLEASGLRAEVVKPQPPTTRWIHLDGRVLRAPSLALLARMGAGRALLEPLFAKPLREDVPLSVFLERRLGKRAGGIAALVLSAGVYAGDPARLSARDAFPSLGAMGEKGSLLVQAIRGPRAPRGGIWTLRSRESTPQPAAPPPRQHPRRIGGR